VDVSKLETFLIRFIGALYKSGYDELEFRYNDPKILKGTLSHVNELYPGFEVMEQTDTKVVIKDIGQQMGTSFDVVLRRLFAVTLSLSSSFREALEKKDIVSMGELMSLEKSNNRFYNFCGRLLSKYGHKEYKVAFIYAIVWELERIADEYKYVYEELKNTNLSKVTINPESIALLKQSEEMLNDFYKIFYKFDLATTRKIFDARNKIRKSAMQLMSDKKGVDVQVAFCALTIGEKVRDILGSYLATVHYEKLTG